MNRSMIFALGLAMLAPLVSYGISRVGNGTVKDERLGFSAEIPKEYLARELNGGTIRFSALRENSSLATPIVVSLASGFPGMRIEKPVVTFDLRSFDSIYTDLTKLEVPVLRERLLKNDFRRLETTHSCIEAFLAESRTDYTLITVWGQGLGTVMIGEKSATTLRGMLGVLNTTRSQKGSCQWK